MVVWAPTVTEPTSETRPTVLPPTPAGAVSSRSRSAMKLWVRLRTTSRSAMRGLPGTVSVELTMPGPVGMATGTSVEV